MSAQPVGLPKTLVLGLLLAMPVGTGESQAVASDASARNSVDEVKASAFPAQRFGSRPDLSPPQINITKRAHSTAPGYIFLSARSTVGGQNGPLIVDNRGQVIWFNPRPGRPSNLHLIEFRGRPALTWWEGQSFAGYGRGEWIVVDQSYREIGRIKAGNGIQADFHDLSVTDQTAIVTSYVVVNRDLSSIGGAPNTNVLDSVAQEVDLRTGQVLFEWRSLDHVPFSESSRPPPRQPGQPYDYFHINSIDIDNDGHLLISGRRPSAVYKVNRKSGQIIWRLGGKRSTFKMSPGTEFKLQHDAERQADGTITVFDNGEAPAYRQSRGISLRLDTKTLEAKLRRTNKNPEPKLSASQGNFQALSRGNFFAGWGSLPNFTEFDRKGRVIYNASLPQGTNSYRAYKSPWVGRPAGRPAAVIRARRKGGVRLYVSWNGDTGVTKWQVLGGKSPRSLRLIRSEPRRGFETKIDLRTRFGYFAVRGKTRSGRTLGTSRTFKR